MMIQRSLKKAMQNPAIVTGLDMRQIKPTILFPEIALFTNLEYIDFSNCNDLNWADACIKLSKLPKLAELKVFGADVQNLPAEIGLLTSLKKIGFCNNPSLTALPETFSALVALEEIIFYNCGLTTLPQATWHFPNLHTLTLDKNKLETIPSSFFDGMPELQYLFLQNNQLKNLPESIGNLKELRLLYAGCNQLADLPESFSSFTNLETIWLDTCPSMDFELALQKLKYAPIKNLNVLENNLTSLPTAIKNFTSLEVLNINSNKIDDTWQLLKDLSALPLTKLDIRFMGNESISLEQAKAIIPSLQEIFCDVRSNEQYASDVTTWLTRQLSA